MGQRYASVSPFSAPLDSICQTGVVYPICHGATFPQTFLDAGFDRTFYSKLFRLAHRSLVPMSGLDIAGK